MKPKIRNQWRSMIPIIIACLWCWVDAFAIPAIPKPYSVTQPDGTTITVRLCGDEYYHYYATEDGTPITLCEDGYYRYTTVDAQNNLVASENIVGKVNTSLLSDKKSVVKRLKELYKINKTQKVANIPGVNAPMRSIIRNAATDGNVVKGIIILVEFQDQKFTFGQSVINEMMNKEGYTDKYGSIGSARDYFVAQSYGQFQPEFNVVGPVTLSQDMAYYGASDEYGVDIRPHEMVAEACQLASQQGLVDMSDYDNDGDGWVDLVYIIYAGYGENTGADPSTIWPHAGSVYSSGNNKVTINGVTLDAYACSAELYGNSGSDLCGIGTFCHEYSHTLGLPDFYDIDYSGAMGMSEWSIMDSGCYGLNGYVPIGYNAHERELCGWLELNELIENTSITMPELNTDKTAAYKITSTNANQYIILETRCKKGWDISLPTEGMMVIAVDYSLFAWERNGPNDDPNRQRFKLIPADNNWSTASLYGDLYPYRGNTTLSSTSSPKMQVHNTTINGKSITSITYNNDVVTFDFEKEDLPGDEPSDDLSYLEGTYKAFANSALVNSSDEKWQVAITIDESEKNKVWIQPVCMFAGLDASDITPIYATYNSTDNTLIMPLGQIVYEDTDHKLVIAETIDGSEINISDNIILQINKNDYGIEISFESSNIFVVCDILNNNLYQALFNILYSKITGSEGSDEVPAEIEGVYNAFANSAIIDSPDEEWQVNITIDETEKNKVWIQPVCMFGGLEASDISPIYATYRAIDNTLIMPLGQVVYEDSDNKLVIVETTDGSDKNLTDNIILQINKNGYAIEISFESSNIIGIGDIMNDVWWYQALYNISYSKIKGGEGSDEVPAEIEGVYNAFANSAIIDSPDEEWQVNITIDETEKNKVWIQPVCMFGGLEASDISPIYATYNASDNTLIMPLGQVVYEDSDNKLVIAETTDGSDKDLTSNIILQINNHNYDHGIEILFANNNIIGIGDIMNDVWWYQALYNISYSKATFEGEIATSITLDKSEVNLKVDQTTTLVATVLPETTTNKAVTWKSSNATVAIVDNNGVVTAIAVGEAIITASTTDGSNLEATCQIIVEPIMVETIILDYEELNLMLNKKQQLTATILPENASNKKVEWTTSDETIVSVSKRGVVKAESIGEAIITATATDGSGMFATCRVIVKPILATSIEITPSTIEAEEGTEVQLTIIINPENATNKDIIWTSSEKSIATVDENGLVNILKEGLAEISATTTDGSNLTATCSVTALSGIEKLENSAISVNVEGNNIVVNNTEPGNQIILYDIDGKIISGKIAVNSKTIITVTSTGVYIIKVNNQIFKVLI